MYNNYKGEGLYVRGEAYVSTPNGTRFTYKVGYQAYHITQHVQRTFQGPCLENLRCSSPGHSQYSSRRTYRSCRHRGPRHGRRLHTSLTDHLHHCCSPPPLHPQAQQLGKVT